MLGVIWEFRNNVSRVIVHDISDLRSVCIRKICLHLRSVSTLISVTLLKFIV